MEARVEAERLIDMRGGETGKRTGRVKLAFCSLDRRFFFIHNSSNPQKSDLRSKALYDRVRFGSEEALQAEDVGGELRKQKSVWMRNRI